MINSKRIIRLQWRCESLNIRLYLCLHYKSSGYLLANCVLRVSFDPREVWLVVVMVVVVMSRVTQGQIRLRKLLFCPVSSHSAIAAIDCLSIIWCSLDRLEATLPRRHYLSHQESKFNCILCMNEGKCEAALNCLPDFCFHHAIRHSLFPKSLPCPLLLSPCLPLIPPARRTSLPWSGQQHVLPKRRQAQYIGILV